MAVLIELKSSLKQGDVEKDAEKALEQIKDKNHRNPENLTDMRTLREYGIACYHFRSHVIGRHLELDRGNEWVEADDPAAMSIS